jgi:hypothetical protein
MERPLLNDKDEYPDDAVLERQLGKAKPAWDALTARVASEFPDASLQWQFYNDGKAWLCRLVRKKETVCWLSVWSQYFKTAFYFTARSDEAIEALPIPPELKIAYRTHEPIGKLKPLVIQVKTKKTLDAVFEVVKYKIGLK